MIGFYPECSADGVMCLWVLAGRCFTETYLADSCCGLFHLE